MKSKIALILCLTVLVSKAQNVYNLSVDELFRLGMENSTKIKVSQIKSDVYEEKEALAKIKKLPTIDLSVSQGYVGPVSIYDKNLSYLERPYMPDWQQNYSLELSQPVYQGGRIKNSVKSASIEKEIAGLDLERDKADVKLVLIRNYLELFKSYKQKEVFLENIKEAKKRLNDIKNLKKEGIVTNNDVLRSQIVVSNYELALEEIEGDIAIISQQLDVVLGLDENQIIVPDSAFLGREILVEPEEYYVQQGYEQFPELKISRFNIEKAKVDEKIVKSKYLPMLSVYAGNTLLRPITNVVPVEDLYMNSWGITIGLSYRLSSWFDHKHALNEAKYNIDFQENMREQTEQNIRINVRSAYIKHKEALNRVEVLKQTVEQAKDNYRIVNNKYFNQLSILTDLLDASSVQLNSELELTSARVNSLYTYYLLLNASGNL